MAHLQGVQHYPTGEWDLRVIWIEATVRIAPNPTTVSLPHMAGVKVSLIVAQTLPRRGLLQLSHLFPLRKEAGDAARSAESIQLRDPYWREGARSLMGEGWSLNYMKTCSD